MHPVQRSSRFHTGLALVWCITAVSSPADPDRSPVEPMSLPAPDQKMEPVKPSINKLDESRYEIGRVVIDKKTREIRVPTRINMTEGLLEYILVHENGKVHESLLVTDVSPTHVNLAFTLLRYPASRELYALPTPTGGLSDKFPEVPEKIKAGSRVLLDVEWKDGDQTRRLPINEWIQHTVTTAAMPSGPWVYGGSEFYDGRYVPEVSGDIAAIFIAQSALINYPGDDNRDDTVWVVYPKRVPAEGTHVTLIIRPNAVVAEKQAANAGNPANSQPANSAKP
jgi:hypothetical protein